MCVSPLGNLELCVCRHACGVLAMDMGRIGKLAWASLAWGLVIFVVSQGEYGFELISLTPAFELLSESPARVDLASRCWIKRAV